MYIPLFLDRSTVCGAVIDGFARMIDGFDGGDRRFFGAINVGYF
jgi:hypothetical protein